MLAFFFCFFKPISVVSDGAKPWMQQRCFYKIVSGVNVFWWNICVWDGELFHSNGPAKENAQCTLTVTCHSVIQFVVIKKTSIIS